MKLKKLTALNADSHLMIGMIDAEVLSQVPNIAIHRDKPYSDSQ